MAMGMGSIHVTAAGQTVTVTPCAADMVAWERYARANKLPLALDAADFPRITHICFLSYAAGKRSALWGEPFDTWLDTLEAVEADSSEDEGK